MASEEDDSPPALEDVEVSVGWQSSPLARAMLDRPSSSSRTEDIPLREYSEATTPLSLKRPATTPGPVGGILGKYSDLLPGSSPPMPRLKVRRHSASTKKPALPHIPAQIPTPEPDLSDDSDLEDLAAMQPADFLPTFFQNRRVLRLVVQSTESLSNSLNLCCTNVANEPRKIILTGSWMRTAPLKGDTVHIIGDNGLQNEAIEVTDSNDLFLIVNPDILVSCTSVAESMSCERQVALRNKVRVPSDINEHTVLGTLKHELIQDCLMHATKENPLKAFEPDSVSQSLAGLLDAIRLDLYLVGIDVETARSKMMELIPSVQAWAKSLFGSSGRPVDTHRGQTKLKIKIRRTAQVEEEIRSPFWGLIGKPDVTVDAIDMNAGSNARLAGLEIKTGKNTAIVSHRAQTTLYTLLLAERHPKNTHPWSLLYYTESGDTIAVITVPSEVRSLIQQRNVVAQNMWRLPDNRLPTPAAASEKICGWCSRKNSCGLYTATLDGGNTWNSPGLSAWFNVAMDAGKFTERFLQFYSHWSTLLDLEHDIDAKSKHTRERQWWLTSASPALLRATQVLDSGTPRLHVYQMTNVDPQDSDKSCEIAVNDRVIVSTKQHMGVAFGLCLESQTNYITIAVSNELMRSAKYRVDTERWAQDGHLGLARNNLVSLMDHDRLRELVVNLVPPQFANLSTKKIKSTADWASGRVLSKETQSTGMIPDESLLSEEDVKEMPHLNLNDDQTAALNKVLSARDYALILGMPGTGKTTTIAAIVATLVDKKQSILISGYTNSAVDTIVLKLLNANIDCLRLGSDMSNVHPDVKHVSATAAEVSGNYERFLEAPVVACTSHYVNHKLFALRNFDYCIVDEASQITLPFCLGPLRLASKFVLVGDHYQLPPLVRNQNARARGFDQSLFKLLCEAHPSSVAELTKQYRMCEDIMSLSSELVYSGRLTCGNSAVAHQKLDLPHLNRLNPQDDLLPVIDPEHRVVFLNTDVLGERAYEKERNGGISNPVEATIIQRLVQKFSQAGLNLREAAVISVYRWQLSQLSELLSPEVASGLEVLTADQAQGRDKRCILVSLVRSNLQIRTGELLKDWRRLNVAFTRAKQKLIIVGSGRMMKAADGVARYFELIEQRNWVKDANLADKF